MTKATQTEIHRLLTTLAAGDFFSYGQSLKHHEAFKRLEVIATAPRYPEGNEHLIRSKNWQELVSMEEYAQGYGMKAVVQQIQSEMQRRLLKLVPEGEAVTGDVLAESRGS